MPQTRKRTRLQSRAVVVAASSSDAAAPPETRWQQQQPSNSAAVQEEEDDSDEDEDDEDVVLSEQFTGSTDAAGRPHGRGALTIHFQRGKRRGRNDFTGSFSHGVKSGAGGWRFDVGGPSESSLTGTFANDALEGEGRYIDSDGSYTVGHYKDGSLHGQVNEYTADGRLLYSGQYRDNQRHGRGTLHHNDGGTFEGEWRHGLFHGTANTYTYPVVANKVIQFRGEWRDGSMHATRVYVDGQQQSETTYTDDESTLGSSIANHPLLADPYEQHTVFVAPSSLGPQAGEGLFARVDLPAGVCVSFYGGLKQSEAETERRHWRYNGNCIALDEAAGIDIDVPPHLASTAVYCASLGHKANHTFDPRRQNCEYWHYYHPRQGHIKCVRVRHDTVGGVKAGVELLVEYGYDKRGGPQWWKEGKKIWKAEEAARERDNGKITISETTRVEQDKQQKRIKRGR